MATSRIIRSELFPEALPTTIVDYVPPTEKKMAPAGIAEQQLDVVIKETPKETALNPAFRIPPPQEVVVVEKQSNINTQVDFANAIERMRRHDFGDTFNFDHAVVLVHKAMLASTEGNQEELAISIRDMRLEMDKMSKERAKEMQEIADYLERNKWYDLISLTATAVGGAAALATAATGFGAALVITTTALLILIHADQATGGYGLENIAAVGTGGDTIQQKENLETLRVVSALVETAASLINIAYSALAVTGEAWGLVRQGSSFVMGLSQAGSAIDKSQNQYHEAAKDRLHFAEEHEESLMESVLEYLKGDQTAVERMRRVFQQMSNSSFELFVSFARNIR